MVGIRADTPLPINITLKQGTRMLAIAFEDGCQAEFSCELLRVFSPSAEVRGHGPGQEVLQIGKREVNINAIEPVGNYAIRLLFSDGHDSGIYTWDYLYELSQHADAMWQDYLARLEALGASRDPEAPVPAALQPKATAKSCSQH